MLLHPSSLLGVPVVWDRLLYCCAIRSCAVWVGGMLCPLSSQVMEFPPHPHVCSGTWLVGSLAVGFRVAWLIVG